MNLLNLLGFGRSGRVTGSPQLGCIVPKGAKPDALLLLVANLIRTVPGFTITWSKAAPLFIDGITIECETIGETALVVPFGAGEHRIVGYGLHAVPDGSGPRYELLIHSAETFGIGCPNILLHLVSADAHDIVAALVKWKDTAQMFPAKVGTAIDRTFVELLRRQANAITAARQNPVRVEMGQDVPNWLLAIDMAAISARLTEYLPRDADGNVALGIEITLLPLEPNTPLTQSANWLVAMTASRKRDRQVVTLAIKSAIGINHVHRWDITKWMWDPREDVPGLAMRWGIADLDVASLGLENRDRMLALFEAKSTRTQADNVGYCILLQDAGRYHEALDLFGIEVDESLWRLLDRQVLHQHFKDHTDAWADDLDGVFRRFAPWVIQSVISPSTEIGNERKSKLKTKAFPVFRLKSFPGQRQQKKLSILLVDPVERGSTARLALCATGTNSFLPCCRWQRPSDIDYLRFDLFE